MPLPSRHMSDRLPCTLEIAVGHTFRKADPDQMLSSNTTFVWINRATVSPRKGCDGVRPDAMGRVDLGGRPPRSPTDPDVPVKGIRLVTLWRCPSRDPSACGNTLVRLGVLGVVPASGPQRGTPFAPRGPVGPVPPIPRYSGALRLLAVPLAALRFLRWAIPSVVPDSSP